MDEIECQNNYFPPSILPCRDYNELITTNFDKTLTVRIIFHIIYDDLGQNNLTNNQATFNSLAGMVNGMNCVFGDFLSPSSACVDHDDLEYNTPKPTFSYPPLDTKIRFVMHPTVFTRNSTDLNTGTNVNFCDYYNDMCLNSTVPEELKSKSIHIFLRKSVGGSEITGATASGQPSKDEHFIVFKGLFRLFNDLGGNQNNFDYAMGHGIARTMAHEVGHLFGLSHTFGYNDYIPDTWDHPIGTSIGSDGYSIPPLGDNYIYASNNLMAYQFDAPVFITPQQIGIMRYWILNNYLNIPALQSNVYNLVIDSFCDIPSADFIIDGNTNMIFNSKRLTDKNIRIKSGSTLKLNCELFLPPQGRIIVERGAKLILDNATIKSTCNLNSMIAGIEVWGNKNISHFSALNSSEPFTAQTYINAPLDSNDPGMVILMNNATIENGPNGAITTLKSDEPWNDDFYGGIIYAENATFRNNKRAVEFMKYLPLNYSKFVNCNFTMDADSPLPYDRHISMWNTNGVTFDNCTFDYTEMPGDSPPDYAITGWDANVNIINNCHFMNYNQPVYLLGFGYTGETNRINDSHFHDAINPIYIDGISLLDISTNVFNSANSSYTVGNQIMNGDYGKIAVSANIYNGFTESIIFSSCDEGVKEIINNTIDAAGHIAEGGITAEGANDHLDIFCNDFRGMNYDISTVDASNGEIGTMRIIQGAPDNPAGNRFTSNPTTGANFFISPSTIEPYSYYKPDVSYPISPRYNPIDDGSVDEMFSDPGVLPTYCALVQSLGCDKTNPYFYNCIINGLHIIRTEIAQNELLIEAGAGDELINLLNNAPAAYSTYTTIKSNSPYLSQEVLSALTTAAGMNIWYRLDLLVKNAPLSDEILMAAYMNMPAYIYTLLYNISVNNDYSAIKILKAHLSRQKTLKEEMIGVLLSKYLGEDDFQKAEEVLLAEQEDEDIRRFAHLMLIRSQVSRAYNSLPYLSLSDENTEYLQLYDVIKKVYTGAGDAVTENDRTMLEAVAESSYSANKSSARALLSFLYDVHYELEPILRPETSGKTSIQLPLPTQESILRILPNPNDGHFKIGIEKNPGKCELTLRNINGELISHQWVREGDFIQDFEVKGVGIYLLSLEYQGIVIDTEKIVVQ